MILRISQKLNTKINAGKLLEMPLDERRSLTIWLALICAEIIHGILRAVVLVPIVGEFHSNQIGVFTGSAIILAIAYFTIRWIGAQRLNELMLVGLIWLVLTVAFEILFGRFVAGLSWERIASDYDVLNGGLMPLGLLVLFFSPLIAAKLRGEGSSQDDLSNRKGRGR